MRKTILAATAALVAWGVAGTASAQQTNDTTQQPLTGSYQLQQPLTGTYQLQQPLTGSYQLQQPLTGTSQLQQPLTGSSSLSTGSSTMTGSSSLSTGSSLSGSSSLTGSTGLDSSLTGGTMNNYVQQPTLSNYGYQPPPLESSPLLQPSTGSTGTQQPGQ